MVRALALGIGLGNSLFNQHANEAAFRKQVILFLMLFAVISLLRIHLSYPLSISTEVCYDLENS